MERSASHRGTSAMPGAQEVAQQIETEQDTHGIQEQEPSDVGP